MIWESIPNSTASLASHMTNATGDLLMRTRSIWQLLVLAVAAPALAHHSASGYDLTKTYTAEVTIQEFRWGAPHTTAVMVMKDKNGKNQEMIIASTTPANFVKQGFKLKDFKVGDKVAITWHPARNGNPGGTLSTINLGRTYFQGRGVSPFMIKPSYNCCGGVKLWPKSTERVDGDIHRAVLASLASSVQR
jgi:hypothetical protein